MKAYLYPLHPLAIFATCLLLAGFVSRFFMSIWQLHRFGNADQFTAVLLNGEKIDIATLAVLALPAILLLTMAFLVPRFQKPLLGFYQIWLFIALVGFLFLEITTPVFIDQFDIRPNRLFIEYLGSPREISSMLAHGFLLPSATVLLVTLGAGYGLYRLFRLAPRVPATTPLQRFLLVIVFAGLLLGDVVVGRGGLQHRPINSAMVAVSNDSLVNSLALNSTFSVLHAYSQLRHESEQRYPYGEMSWQEAIEIVRRHMDRDVEFIDDTTYHRAVPFLQQRTKPKHLIMVVEESLGSTFLASHGGAPVTPNLERWRQKSWFLDNLYATGIRSARGMEALTTGFPPTPSRAVLKLPRAQDHFFTLANYLKQSGYDSTFIYGGESHFDNMKGFFLNNGFDHVIDEKDYENPVFHGSWGVSDEDLFQRSLAFLEEHRDKPQFVLIFTSSNHPPYEFPDGRIELYDQATRASAVNAAKYADYALGQFLDTLESSGYLSTATVLVVADHEDRVFGADPVPLDLFHIPAMIIDPDITPNIDRQLASQLDLAPTLVSLLGLSNPHPMIGHDLNKTAPEDGRVISQFGNNQAYMKSDCTVYLQPDRKMLSTCQFSNEAERAEFENTALAHAVVAQTLYSRMLYRDTPPDGTI